MSEIDRLIEEGLSRYGVGDLDGALEVWEQALAMDPENAQANSYVDYVRMNYELLTNDASREEDAPFAISAAEPDYQIEILPGEEPPAPGAALRHDSIDEGWYFEDEAPRSRPTSEPEVSRTMSADYPQITLELDSDAPPDDEPDEPTIARSTPHPDGVSFEDATREYPDGRGQPSPDLLERAGDPIVSEFRPEETPPFGQLADFHTPTGGWITQLTDVRKRDLGFVQPVVTAPRPASPIVPPEPRPKRGTGPPELKMTLRTPEPPAITESSPDAEPEPEQVTLELGGAGASASDDLIESLPSPTPLNGIAGLNDGRGSQSGTRELPSPTRPPATQPMPIGATPAAPGVDALLDPRTNTSDFGPQPTGDFNQQQTEKLPLSSVELRHDRRDVPTGQMPAMTRPPARRGSDEVPPINIAAPTRDLGIRPAGTQPPLGVTPQADNFEDDTTIRAREIRTEPRAREPSKPPAQIVAEFDPVDTRSARILSDIDVTIPPNESKDDRTRRRITTLFERASAWTKQGDQERAVAAVDLALAEDPNSALAQKLIHRHRDVVQSVFQAFLGNTDRIPVLARPLHELATAPISPRAAFLLSRVDGILSLEEILDVSGMPRIEASRYLCQLFLRGILR